MRIALYEPDIPQNTGTILRLCACLVIEAHIIEPAGFPTTDRAFRRAGMDYLDQVDIPASPNLGSIRGLAQRGLRAADPFHHTRPVVLSRPRVSARRYPAVRPRIVGRGQQGPRGRRRKAGHSDAGRLALAQCGDGGGNGGRRGDTTDRVTARRSRHPALRSESTGRVRDSTRPEALPLPRIARLALVVTRRLPSPHA